MSNTENTTVENTAPTADGSDGTNDTRRNEAIKQIKSFGRDAASGKDSLPKLAHYVTRLAADGVITAKKGKDGDDTAELYGHYVTAESNKAMHEHSAGGSKANISKLRQLVALGEMTTIDPVELLQSAFDIRAKLVAANAEADKDEQIKLKSAYPFYVDVARAQIKSDTLLTDDEIMDLASKSEPKEKDAEAILKQIDKLLQGLVSGENSHGVKDDSESVETAAQCIAERLAEVVKDKAVATLRANAAKLGVTLA